MKNRYSVYADDVMYEDIGAGYSFDDLTARLSDHITEKQLKDTKVWALTVKQFAQTSDGFGIDDSDRGWRCEYWGKLMRGACFVTRGPRVEDLFPFPSRPEGVRLKPVTLSEDSLRIL